MKFICFLVLFSGKIKLHINRENKVLLLIYFSRNISCAERHRHCRQWNFSRCTKMPLQAAPRTLLYYVLILRKLISHLKFASLQHVAIAKCLS